MINIHARERKKRKRIDKCADRFLCLGDFSPFERSAWQQQQQQRSDEKHTRASISI